MRHLVYFFPCLFSPLTAAASPAGAALLVAREMLFFHFYCNLLIFFSPLWAQNLLLLPSEALGIISHTIYNLSVHYINEGMLVSNAVSKTMRKPEP